MNFSLTFVGQGPEKLCLRWLVWRLGLRGSVQFAGQIPHENMADMYNRADVFVAPGRKTTGGDADGVPSALVEALAFGLAVVASDLPAMRKPLRTAVMDALCRKTMWARWLTFWKLLPPDPRNASALARPPASR